MKKFCFILFFLFSLFCQAQEWPVSSIQTKPGSRWWWLGSAVTEQELSRSMSELASHGIHTLEITPIYGVKGNDNNNIDFLSPRWMDILRFVEQTGLRDSIQIDMNCGTGWPFGGPEVPLDEASCFVGFRVDTFSVSKTRVMDFPVSLDHSSIRTSTRRSSVSKEILQTAKLQRVIAYSLEKKGIYFDLTSSVSDGHVHWKMPKGRWQVLSLYVLRTLQKVKRPSPGGEGWVIDHFNRDAVAHYLQRFDKAFLSSGVSFPATFFNDSYEVYGADWTPTLLDEFKVRRGYDLEPYLPDLLLGGEHEAQVLIDYRATLGEMLLQNFTQQWTEWAHSHGVRTRNQAHGSPANLIDVYAAVDIPEVEGFGLSDFGIKGLRTDSNLTRPNYSDLSMLKYASSAAHITGKPLTSCETFTWLTEHFRTSLSQLKPDMDLVFCAGVNRMFFHGTCYSPSDDPWPGWKFYASIDMSPTNSIWRDSRYFTDYVGRCQRFLQWGKPDNDFLVYLPVRDMWSKRKGDLLMLFEISNMDKNAPEFIDIVLKIDSLGYDCDYISDQYLMTTSFENGKLTTASGTTYKALILPESSYMPESVKQHIEELKRKGAPIVSGSNLMDMSYYAKPETIKSLHRMKAIRRSNEKGYHYFIANLTPNDVDEYVSLSVAFKSVALFNPMNGDIYQGDVKDGKVRLQLKSGESIIVQTFSEELPIDGKKKLSRIVDFKDLTNQPWSLHFVESEPATMPTYQLSRLQSWEQLDRLTGILMGTGVYTTTFELSKEQASQPWQIALGDVRESARVYINGHLIGCAWAVPFMLDCKDALKGGKNELRIEVTNLPANRIAEMDRKQIPWRKFNDINVVDIHYQPTKYAHWSLVPSGLNSNVILYRME